MLAPQEIASRLHAAAARAASDLCWLLQTLPHPLCRYPIEHGIVTNWDDMEKIWHHTFYNVRAGRQMVAAAAGP